MRILPRGEIESLERTRVARLRFPEPAGVFSDRASRLRSLAASSPLADYLKLMAVLADAHVDVEYMYSLFAGKDGHAYMILRITNEAAFTQALSGTDIKLVSAADLGLK